MKKFILFFLLIAFCFTLGHKAAALLQERKAKPPVLGSAAAKTDYTLTNHPFVVVVVGFNNGAGLEKTLESIFSQNYNSFRLIYIDDASTDGSGSLAQERMNQMDRLIEVTFVQNEKRVGKLANMVRALEACSDEEIVVVLDGEDWLSHEWILQKLNAVYKDPDIWMGFFGFLDYPTFQFSPKLKKDELKIQALSFYLKSFYAKLFKKIDLSDLMDAGAYLSTSKDLIYTLPMIEMARDHIYVSSEVFSIHNKEAFLKEEGEEEIQAEKFLRALKSYPPLLTLSEGAKCD